MHRMLAMNSAVDQSNWATPLPFVQLSHSTSFSATMHETILLSVRTTTPAPSRYNPRCSSCRKNSRHRGICTKARFNLQIAFELARRNRTERAKKKAEHNSKLKPYPVFKPGQEVLVYRPYQDSDGPKPNLLLPWRGPCVVRSQISPVVYRVRLTNDTQQVSLHLAHIKPYHQQETPPAPHFEKLVELFLGEPIPPPELDDPDAAQPKTESYSVDWVIDHKRRPGRPSRHNYKYRLRLRGYGPESDLEYCADEIPKCHK